MANSALGREMCCCLVKGLGMSEGPHGQVNTTSTGNFFLFARFTSRNIVLVGLFTQASAAKSTWIFTKHLEKRGVITSS